jgi:hypothetical protein
MITDHPLGTGTPNGNLSESAVHPARIVNQLGRFDMRSALSAELFPSLRNFARLSTVRPPETTMKEPSRWRQCERGPVDPMDHFAGKLERTVE